MHHSPGSGKSLTIALLAYALRLQPLPRCVARGGGFRLILVLTDRRCLDEQLGAGHHIGTAAFLQAARAQLRAAAAESV